MRHLLSLSVLLARVRNFFKNLSLKSSPQDGEQSEFVFAFPERPAASRVGQNLLKPIRPSEGAEGQRWWGGVAAWGIHGNEEFTKWWNHWMSRIPDSRASLNSNLTRKNDV